MGVAAAFEQAIDLQHIPAQPAIPDQQCFGHGGCAGDPHAHSVQAQPGEYLVADPLADEGQAQQGIEAACG